MQVERAKTSSIRQALQPAERSLVADFSAFGIVSAFVFVLYFDSWPTALLLVLGIGVFAIIGRGVAALFKRFSVLAFIGIFVTVPAAITVSYAASITLTQYGGIDGFTPLFIQGVPTLFGLLQLLTVNIFIALALVLAGAIAHAVLKQTGDEP